MRDVPKPCAKVRTRKLTVLLTVLLYAHFYYFSIAIFSSLSLCLRFSITLPFSLSMPPAIQASSTVAGAVGTETTETVRHKYGDDAAAVQ